MNEKSENRKALPKFFLTMLGALLIGGAIGFAVGLSHVFVDASSLADGLNRLLGAATPWGIPVSSILLLGGCFFLYRAAKKKFDAWGGGDEDDVSESIDILLSWVLLLSVVQLLIDFFFMAAIVYYAERGRVLFVVGTFLLSCGLVIFAQQKVVDLTKRMNPEKRGSVYDTQFQKKWYSSLDESERQQTGQACYRAYMVTSRLCLGLWMVLVILSMVFPISLLPTFVLLLIWGVMQVSYTLECMRLSKKKAS